MPDLKTLEIILIEAAKCRLPDLTAAPGLEFMSKLDGSIVTEIDTALQREIQMRLQEKWPHIPMMGEEMSHDLQMDMLKFAEAGLWILDPLDGTTNFTKGYPVFGLSLAYVQKGKTTKAVIYDPNRDECFSAAEGEGAWLNGVRLQPGKVNTLADCIANVDYKRLTAVLATRLVSCPPYRSQRNIGSCVLEWCWLAADRIQLYLHGGQHLWDHAAGRLVLSEAGGVASRLDGQILGSGKLVKQSAIAAANPKLFKLWFDWVAQQN